MICFCGYCRYTFPADSLPDRCPDCGRQIHNGEPAVRAATAKEIADYERIQQELMEEASEEYKTSEIRQGERP